MCISPSNASLAASPEYSLDIAPLRLDLAGRKYHQYSVDRPAHPEM